MEAEASNLTENVPSSRSSGVDTQGGQGSVLECGIKVPDGAILLDYTRTVNIYLMMTRSSYLMK